MNSNLRINKFKIKDIKRVKNIYYNSFPKEERFSIFLLMFNLFKKYCKLYTLIDNENVVGFIYYITYENMIFILYLAVDKSSRGNGYGKYLLRRFIQENKEKDLYLNIDKIDEKFSDIDIRKKRLKFYIENGFHLTDYLSLEEKVDFNILSTREKIDVIKYKKLDEKIAKLFFDKKSNIVKGGKNYEI